MAEAFFNRLSGKDFEALSAGTQPAPQINPLVVQVMREAGLDLGIQKPKRLTISMIENADRIITMGCGSDDACPLIFGPAEDWQLEDPEGKSIEKVREIRDSIDIKVSNLVKELRYPVGSFRNERG